MGESDEDEVPVDADDSRYIFTVGPHDVLLGRGTGPNNNQGNITFRNAVEEAKKLYTATVSRKEKSRIVKETVESVKRNNGRFLAKLEKSELRARGLAFKEAYEIAPDSVAIEKVKQALRYVCYKKGVPKYGKRASSDATEEQDVAPAKMPASREPDEKRSAPLKKRRIESLDVGEAVQGVAMAQNVTETDGPSLREAALLQSLQLDNQLSSLPIDARAHLLSLPPYIGLNPLLAHQPFAPHPAASSTLLLNDILARNMLASPPAALVRPATSTSAAAAGSSTGQGQLAQPSNELLRQLHENEEQKRQILRLLALQSSLPPR